ncbi:MAG: hypothetical protein ACE5OZ_03765 [Candidatus Heimdallarchaeota archaeon]
MLDLLDWRLGIGSDVISLIALQDFLESSKSISQDIRTIWTSRPRALTDRLTYFHPEVGFIRNRWDLGKVRYWGLKAAISFIQQTPYLHHTPASLRALFSVPTRSQRKKGKHSSAALRRTAKELGLSPDWVLLDRLASYLYEIRNKDPKIANLLVSRIEKIKTRQIDVSIPKWKSDHSVKSLGRLEEFLTKMFPEAVVSEFGQNGDSELTPDLVLRMKEASFYVELKEWEAGFRLLFKPSLQIFRYSLNAQATIFVLAGYPPTIFDDLHGTWTGSEFLRKIEGHIDTAKKRIRSIEKFRRALLRFLKNLEDQNLNILEICALITIAEELFGEKLGISAMEYSSARELQTILEANSSTQIYIRDCNLHPCNDLNLNECAKKGTINILLIKGFQ